MTQQTNDTRVALSGMGAMGSFILNALQDTAHFMQVVGILNREADATHPQGERSVIPTHITGSGYRFHAAKTGQLIHVSDSFDVLSEWKPDVMVDFSHSEWTTQLLPECVEREIPFVVGTSGLSHDFIDDIKQQVEHKQIQMGARIGADGNLTGETPGIGGFIVPNFSLGAIALQNIAQQFAGAFDNVEIVEQHHAHKADAPSGTALNLARIIRTACAYDLDDARDIPTHSVRMPTSPATNMVIFGNTGEILTVKHESLAKDSFLPGILQCIQHAQHMHSVTTDISDILLLD